MSTRTLLLLTVDTEASMSGLRPLPPESMIFGRLGGETYGIERIMDCCEARGFRATFFVDTLEALHYGDDLIRSVCSGVLERGHDAQLHVHPIWLGGRFVHKALTSYGWQAQLEAIERAAAVFSRACGAQPLVHRAGGLWFDHNTLRALAATGIGLDASVARGYHGYDLGDGLAPPTVPRRLGGVVEVPVTTFAQVRLGPWASTRNFDLNPDSLSELKFVVDRAVAAGVTAVSMLMHSFSFVGRNRGSTSFWPLEGEVQKFERFLDLVAARDDVEVVTFRELAGRLEAEPGLLGGPDFSPTTGLLRTYRRSWERFETGWKSKAFALGVPLVAAGLVALAFGTLRWLR